MSTRRLWVLTSRMPQDSHTARVLHGELAEWRMNELLLARLINTLIQVNSTKTVPQSSLVLPPRGR